MTTEKTQKIFQVLFRLAMILTVAAALASCAPAGDGAAIIKSEKVLVRRLSRELDLTSEQRDVLVDVISTINEMSIGSWELDDAEADLVTATIMSDSPDASEVWEIRDAHIEEIEARRAAVYTEILRFHAVLTVEQREILAGLIVDRF